jgi:DNA-binding CsgD family transcriptional regulator/drug/metabolite transporter superfamily protein YnfA
VTSSGAGAAAIADTPTSEGNIASTSASNENGYGDILRRLLSVIMGPFIGFLLFALTMAVRKVFIFEMLSAESLGTILAAIVVIPLWLRRSEKPLLPFVYQVFLPIVAALLIILNSFPSGSAMHAIGFLGIYIFFAIIGLLALTSFNAAANAREFSVALIFGLALATFSAVSIIGLRFEDIPLISNHSEELLLVLSTLYFVYLVLSPGLRAWRSMFAPAKTLSAHSIKENLEARCEELARSCGLSRRESEIMLFIGRGYGPAFIAKKLVLSDSTVRSHVKNIYRKLGVNAREALLQVIDEE